jgi:hypothetical protein
MSQEAEKSGVEPEQLRWLRHLDDRAALRTFLVLGATFLLVCTLAAHAAIYLRNSFDAVRYPFGLDYGEGIVWQQALLIPGPRMYGPIAEPPFIVFHYPPIYHLAVRALTAIGFDTLAAGRGLSVACTLGAAALSAWLVRRAIAEYVNHSALLVGCAIGALLPLSLGAVGYWSVLMRVDMLALCLSFMGVALTVESFHRSGWLALAAPAFVLAVYTKQTLIAAPLAALVVSLIWKGRPALLAALFGAGLGLTGFAGLEWLTGGGFARHVLTYNINTYSITRLLIAWRMVGGAYAMLFLSAIGALLFLWRQDFAVSAGLMSRHPSKTRHTLAVVTLWLSFAALTTLTAGKEGSAVNYFIELLYVSTIPVAMTAALAWQKIVSNRAPGNGGVVRVLALSLTAGLLVQLAAEKPYRYPRIDDPEGTNIQLALTREIAQSTRPVLSEDMVLLLRAGQEVPIEPAIFKELATVGTWDQAPFLQQLRNNAFAFVIMMDPSRYTPEMLAAIAQAYPFEEKLGSYRISRALER